MIITWYGQSCFRLQSGKETVLFDPFDKKIGLNPPRVEANLVLVSHDHYDHNNTKTVKGEPFLVQNPGEYEYMGIRVNGIRSFHDEKEGEERGLNTIYTIKMEDMLVAHLGDLGQKELSDTQLERIGNIDILMVPVGGTFTINAERAVSVINQIEPRIVIPMHYKVKGLNIKLDPVDNFLKAIGKKDVKAQDKFTLKKKDLPQEQMDIVVLKI